MHMIIHKNSSRLQKIKYGELQGTVVGPTLFTLYINELINLTTSADGTGIV